MNINGAASLYGLGNPSWMNPASALNDQRLANALKNNPKLSAVAGVGKPLSSDASSFMKDYQSKLTAMMNSSNALRGDNSAGIANSLTAQSSDATVAVVTDSPKRLLPAEYEINVSQTAQQQGNASASLKSDAAATASGAFTIEGSRGTVSFEIGAPDGQTNKDLFNELAKQINESGVGVTATVVEKDGKSSLALISTDTGEQNAFAVSGDFAAQTGLNAVTQQARDASYSVSANGGMAVQKSSSTNDILVGNLDVTLTGAGKTTIGVRPDDKKLTDAIETMVNDYNEAIKFLNDNENRGVGVLQQMKRMIKPPTSLKSMELVGITPTINGTLKFDKDVLAKSLAKDPKLVRDVISGSAGVAQGIFADAKQGMKTPSASLLSATAKEKNYPFASQQDPINFMSAYSKSGVYNMMNYMAVGALMNYNI